MHSVITFSRWLTAIPWLVAAILIAPLAHADDSDFVTTMYHRNLGCGEGYIACTGPADLVGIAKSVCERIDNGGGGLADAVYGLRRVGDNLKDSQVKPLTGDNPLLMLAVASIYSYCPWNGDLVGG